MRIPERSAQTVVEALARTVLANGDKPFLRFEEESTTYADLDRWSNRLTHALSDAGSGRATPCCSCSRTMSTSSRGR